MFVNLKALIVVFVLGGAVLFFAKPIALRFMTEADYSRRRALWLGLTALGFLSPNIWLYALIAIPLLLWAGRKDSNPIALYVFLLHVIPPVGVAIPILGNNGLLPLNNYRMLALCILLPTVLRYRKDPEEPKQGAFGIMDVLLLGLGMLYVALYTPPDLPNHFVIPDSPSNVLRRIILFLLDGYLLYYTVSRTCRSRNKLVDAFASFAIACAVMALIAIFERGRNWLLYVNIAAKWDPSNLAATFYLMRGGSVRAQVAAGHSIALGYLISIAFGFWLYLKHHVENRLHKIAFSLLLLCGLYCTFSRGAWLGAGCIFFAFNLVGPRAVSRFVKGSILAAIGGGLVLLSPVGDRIVEMLPTKGAPADDYRHRLAERGWDVVLAHPWFGDQLPWPKLEDLRQGEGIIDIVNTYLGAALNYGFVGLFVFVGFIAIAMLKALGRSRQVSRSDPDLALMGTSLVACIGGVLVMLDSNSFNMGVEKMFYVLAAFCAAYARLELLPAKLAAQRASGRLLPQ